MGTPSWPGPHATPGVRRLVHVSTAAVYDRSPGMGDVDEASPLVGDDADAYAVTKRDADAALAEVEGLTRVILAPRRSSARRDLDLEHTRPAELRDDEEARHAVPGQSFAWVHVDDLAAPGRRPGRRVASLVDRSDDGPARRRSTVVDVPSGPASARDYYETVAEALGVQPSGRTLPLGPAASWPIGPTAGVGPRP